MRRTFLPKLLKFIVIAGLAIGSMSAKAQSNFLTDLGAGFGWGLNDNGQAVLSSGLYDNGAITSLGMTGFAINASGQVAGETLAAEHAALYSNGTVTDLGVLPGGNVANGNTQAFGINSGGQIVGLGLNMYSVDAFSYSNGTMTDLFWLPGATQDFLSSEAYGVNDSGLIVGISVSSVNTTPSTYDAFSYENGTFTDLGPGAAYAVNAGGQITGVMAANPAASQGNTSPTSGHAFLYTNGTMSDLGVLRGGSLSVGYAVNASGQVVGSSKLTGSSNTHAFFYNGMMTDLNSLIDAADPLKPYVTLTEARGINATRLILVNGIDSRTQQQHAYLMQGPWLDMAPAALAYGSQHVGTASAAQPVTLTNSGTAALAIGISVAGDFSQTSDCGVSLAASANCTVMVKFTPTAAGDRTGTLIVTAGGTSFVVALSGPAPIDLTLLASSSSTTAGTPVTLTWIQSPGSTCSAMGGNAGDGWTGSFTSSGNKSVTESSAATYQLGLMCIAGSQSRSEAVTLAVAPAPITVNLSATPTSITAGQSTTLTWTSTNATSCTATGGSANSVWPGTKTPAGGSQAVLESSAGTIQYALTCTAGSQTGQAQATVTVAWPPVTVTLSASPTTITAGQSTTLTWSSTNATSCSATGGGSGDTWPGARATTGTLDVTEPSSDVTASQTLVFGITCTSSQSGLSSEASADVVENAPPPPPPPAKSGGGAFDGFTLLLLLGVSCINGLRRFIARARCHALPPYAVNPA